MKKEIEQLCVRFFDPQSESFSDLQLLLSVLALDGLHRATPGTTDGICSLFKSADQDEARQLYLELDSFFFRNRCRQLNQLELSELLNQEQFDDQDQKVTC